MPEVTSKMKSNLNQRQIIRYSHFLFITKYRHASFKTIFPVPLARHCTIAMVLKEEHSNFLLLFK